MTTEPKQRRIEFIDLKRLHAPLRQALIDAAARAIDGGAFVGGPEVLDFEQEFAAFCGAGDSIAVANGTDALRLIMQALGIGPGSRVYTVANTFIATAAAASQLGAWPVLVDIDPVSCLMDPSDLRRRLNSMPPDYGRVNVVLPVHLYGQCCDMAAIAEVATEHRLKVVEDACQAHGAEYHGRRAGSLGVAAAFSFYPSKNLGALGEGGAVTTSDPQLAAHIRMLRDHGSQRRYLHEIEGWNSRLDALQCAFLRIKLKYMESWNFQRRKVADRYDARFSNSVWPMVVKILPHNLPSRHLYVIQVPDRQGLHDYLAGHGISTAFHYPTPLHLQPAFAHLGLKRGDFPAAEWSCDHLISLPLHPLMDERDADTVADAVAAFIAQGVR